jgi:hypothetical protein
LKHALHKEVGHWSATEEVGEVVEGVMSCKASARPQDEEEGRRTSWAVLEEVAKEAELTAILLTPSRDWVNVTGLNLHWKECESVETDRRWR